MHHASKRNFVNVKTCFLSAYRPHLTFKMLVSFPANITKKIIIIKYAFIYTEILDFSYLYHILLKIVPLLLRAQTKFWFVKN